MGYVQQGVKEDKSKGKKMFNLLNKAGREYKVAIFHFMRRILKEEVIPYSFRKTWLLGIWKRKRLSIGFKYDEVCSFKRLGGEIVRSTSN